MASKINCKSQLEDKQQIVSLVYHVETRIDDFRTFSHANFLFHGSKETSRTRSNLLDDRRGSPATVAIIIN
jgi:hypothetical protein